MRIRAVVWIIAGVLLLGLTGRVSAQYTPPSDQLLINAQKAVTWNDAAGRAKHSSPLKALIELYADCSAFAPTPEAVANGLAYLQIDLTDPDFHAITLAQFRTIRAETKKLLDEAVAARELRPCDTTELARLIQHINDGAMLSWAVYREGPLDKWVRRVLERLLSPYRMAVRRPRRPMQPRRKKH